MLIRLAAVGVLWDSGRRTSKSICISILCVGVIALVRLQITLSANAESVDKAHVRDRF
jgi:hypothetical protein